MSPLYITEQMGEYRSSCVFDQLIIDFQSAIIVADYSLFHSETNNGNTDVLHSGIPTSGLHLLLRETT